MCYAPGGVFRHVMFSSPSAARGGRGANLVPSSRRGERRELEGNHSQGSFLFPLPLHTPYLHPPLLPG